MNAVVGIVAESAAELAALQPSFDVLDELQIAFEKRQLSAYFAPEAALAYAASAASRGLHVIIAGADGASLPGLLAARTTLPVLGVPTTPDNLLAMTRTPAGVAVGAVGFGPAAASNTALLAATIIARTDVALVGRLKAWRAKRTAAFSAETPPPIAGPKPLPPAPIVADTAAPPPVDLVASETVTAWLAPFGLPVGTAFGDWTLKSTRCERSPHMLALTCVDGERTIEVRLFPKDPQRPKLGSSESFDVTYPPAAKELQNEQVWLAKEILAKLKAVDMGGMVLPK